MCVEHRQALHFSISKRAGQGRFDWALPNSADLQPAMAPQRAPLESDRELHLRIAEVAQGAARSRIISALDPTACTQALWSGMAEKGFSRHAGRLHSTRGVEAFEQLLQAMGRFPDWAAEPPTATSAYSALNQVIRNPDRGHPVITLALIALLFDSWREFLSCCLGQRAEAKTHSTAESNEDQTRERLLDRVLNQGQSISTSARSLGVDVSTAQAWVADEGLEPPRRPSKMKDHVLSAVVDRLFVGADIADIAAETHVSQVSVRRALRTNPKLHQRWSLARFNRTRDLSRSAWIAALELEGVVGPGSARSLEPHAYAWLYRNDRDWLMSTNAEARMPKVGNHSQVSWDVRDLQLSQACQRAALALHEQAPGKRITLTAVIRLVPELRTKLCHLSRLPLTARALGTITKRGRRP